MPFETPNNQDLDSFQFTFESYLDDASRIEADLMCSMSPSCLDSSVDTQSLSDSIARYQEEFGRTYHSYHAGSYHFPNDPTETERLDEQYEIMKTVMDGRLHLAPFSPQNHPHKVLDIGTGTGIWAIEMGDEYPEAQIIGTDLSPIQPPFVPPNVRFFVEDSTEEWDFSADFDYIHTRVTIGCWSDMKTQIVQPAFDHLLPGGWLECQEFVVFPECDDGTIPEAFAWKQWALEMRAVSQIANRQFELGSNLKSWFEEVGFVDVHETIYKIPINGWPRDARLKYIGMLWQRNLINGLSGFSLALQNRYGGKTVEDIEVSSQWSGECVMLNVLGGDMTKTDKLL
ncbi:S-adenosyl-L-methionine-dependent methyltransferase [Bombardia bombarda]|uniref:S-adenosyl-L-methionine-dependent methyltransferase n=1 Tax=Bombardia bombarda TaxID=252184 RepID=A0AA40CE57_9PEZI|nr:S-adenosyl-L-methionine-dependent methyltransferase [Bombardia bombarda]